MQAHSELAWSNLLPCDLTLCCRSTSITHCRALTVACNHGSVMFETFQHICKEGDTMRRSLLSLKAGGIKAASNRRDTRFNTGSMILFGEVEESFQHHGQRQLKHNPKTQTSPTWQKNVSLASCRRLSVCRTAATLHRKEICLQSSDAISGRKLSQSLEAAERMRQVPKPDPRRGTGSLLKVSVQSTLTSKDKIKRP